DGILYALRDVSLSQKRVLIIGAGGAARAAAYVLKKHNAQLYWLNRTKKQAEMLAELFGGDVLEEKEMIHTSIDIIIHATPQGMYPNVLVSPLPDAIFHEKQIVFDMVYNPIKTIFLKKAEEKGAKIISGLDMFIGQGIRQVELWIGRRLFSDALLESIKQKL